MNPEMSEFCEGFKGLEKQISLLDKNLKSKKLETEKLKEDLYNHERIKWVIDGLRETSSKEKDLEQYPIFVYYFVKGITPNNIIPTKKPSLYKKCPYCKEPHPVLMKYGQTHEQGSSAGPPEGDFTEVWKNLHLLCA